MATLLERAFTKTIEYSDEKQRLNIVKTNNKKVRVNVDFENYTSEVVKDLKEYVLFLIKNIKQITGYSFGIWHTFFTG